MKQGFVLTALALGVALAAGVARAQAPTWDGVPWRIENIKGAAVVRDSGAMLGIAPDGEANGSSGCNHFGGKASFEGGGLRFGPLSATRMACPPPLMEQEARLFGALSEVRSARVEGPRLLLLSQNGAVLVTLARP